jgi:adenylylsulfate reductase subunit A
MALPNKPAGELKAVRDPEVEEREVDILIVGGGMAACGAAFEVKKWMSDDQSVLLVDKAALERSGAVAQGLSAINTFIGDNSPEDYVRMVRNDLMGIVREDLIFDLGCHVDDSVHLFEEWGLPIWKKSADGKNLDGKKGQQMGTLKSGASPVRTGKWQIMINGESYKRIVAEAAKLAIGEENVLERVFIVELLLDANRPNQIAGPFQRRLRPGRRLVPAVQSQDPQRSGRKLCRQRSGQERAAKIRALRHGSYYADLSA